MDTEDKLDIIFLGATGFSAKFVLKKLILLNEKPEYTNLTWGISGRSQEKLIKLLLEIKEWGGDVSKIPVIQCDLKNEDSVPAVTRRAKIVMNCTGPNTYLSEAVIKACIATRTHYVDISAELFHVLDIYERYHNAAEQANVLVVPCCGFAVIPSAAGLIHLERQFKGTLHSVECYTKFEFPKRGFIIGGYPLASSGTWKSMICEMKNRRKCMELKSKMFPQTPVPQYLQKGFFHCHKRSCWFPYPGPDQDMNAVMALQYLTKQKGNKEYFYKMYTTMPFVLLLIIVPAFFLAYYLCRYGWFRHLLRKYPRLFSFGKFSHKGPSEQIMRDTKVCFTLHGKGWRGNEDMNSAPASKITVKVSGNDLGYKITATTFILSTLTILKESSNMPKGGVISPKAAFQDTDIVNRLREDGLKIEVVEEEDLDTTH